MPFIYALGHAECLKEAFQGQLLGSVMRSFVWSQPEALKLLVKGEENRESIKTTLNSVRDLFYMDAIELEDKAQLHQLFEKMVADLDAATHKVKRDFWGNVQDLLDSPELRGLKSKLELTPTPQRKSRSRSDSGGSDDQLDSLNPGDFRVQLEAAGKAADLEKKRADEEARKREAAESKVVEKDVVISEKDVVISEKERELEEERCAKAALKAENDALIAKLKAAGLM